MSIERSQPNSKLLEAREFTAEVKKVIFRGLPGLGDDLLQDLAGKISVELRKMVSNQHQQGTLRRQAYPFVERVRAGGLDPFRFKITDYNRFVSKVGELVELYSTPTGEGEIDPTDKGLWPPR